MRAIEELRNLPFPTLPHWSVGKKATVLVAYFEELVGAAEMETLHRTRYAPAGCSHGTSVSDAEPLLQQWTTVCARVRAAIHDASHAPNAHTVALSGVLRQARAFANEKKEVLRLGYASEHGMVLGSCVLLQ